jgi:hypothetical protein
MVRFCGSQEDHGILFAVDQVVGPTRHAAAELGEAEGPFPTLAFVIRVPEQRRACVGIEKADRHGEAGVLEIHWIFQVHRFAPALRRRQQIARRFDAPCLAAIQAAGQPWLFGLAGILLMPVRWPFLEPGCAESNQDFIAPRPDAVIGGPSA